MTTAMPQPLRAATGRPDLPSAVRLPDRRSAVLSWLLVTVAGLASYGWRAGRPGVWRDEAATIAVCRRSLPDVFALTHHLDLVHLPYYLLAKAVWQIDPSVTALRWISVTAMALAAGLLVWLGRALGSQRLGVLAGLLLVVSPFASRYAQEARPFALVTALATVSTLAFVRLVGRSASPRRAALWYGGSVAAVGLLNVLALILVAVHAVAVLVGPARWAERTPLARERAPVRDGAGTVTSRRWAVPTAIALLVIAPFVLATLTQRSQVAWITRPHGYDARTLFTEEFGSRTAPLIAAVLAVAALLVEAGLRAGRPTWRILPPAGPRRAGLLLGLTWAALPVAVLFIGSQLVPLWDPHYLVFTIPGLALALAAAVPARDRVDLGGDTGLGVGVGDQAATRRGRLATVAVGVIAVLVVAGLGLGAQRDQRNRTTGHTEDLASIAQLIGAQARPGDAVVFVPAELRVLTETYPDDFRVLTDPTAAISPAAADNLVGTPVPAEQAPALLAGRHRIWLVQGLFAPVPAAGTLDARTLGELGRDFHRTTTSQIGDVQVIGYQRTAA